MVDRVYGRVFHEDKLISVNGVHVAISVDRVIYDNLHPTGISTEPWQRAFIRIIPPEDWIKYDLDNAMFGIAEGGYATFIVIQTTIELGG
ncbi:papain fold toxin domain-containing protein [Anaerolineales bacterium HSG6]|nr:papain fold toxin domain-containing protein [Anaerolineales bacterium HSG6]